MHVYTHICVCMWVYARVACLYGYMRECILCVYWLPILSVCSVASYSDPDPFGEIRTHYRRFEFVLVVDPIDWRFENRSWDDPEIGVSSCNADQTTIRFQNHVILCECYFLCISLFTVDDMRLHVTLIISCDFLLYFTSLISCITPWAVSYTHLTLPTIYSV